MKRAQRKQRAFGVSILPVGLSLSLLISCVAPRPCFAQAAGDLQALKKRIDALESGQKEIMKQLEVIEKLIATGSATAAVPSSLELDPADMAPLGNGSAKVTVVEYFDYQCPFCGKFFDETMPQLQKDYIATGKMRFVARDFPLEAAHPFALFASETARCANEQGKFWPMHDELMGNSDALDRKSVSLYAQDVGLDLAAFDTCVDSGKYASKIRQAQAEGQKLGVDGTPTFFVGISNQDGKTITSLRRFDGFVPYEQLKTAIDELLAEKSSPVAQSQ